MDNLKVAIVVIVVGLLAYFVGSAMYELMVDVYHLLDEYIWAFFAGIIAFFATLTIVSLMIQITIYSAALVAVALAWILNLFVK